MMGEDLVPDVRKHIWLVAPAAVDVETRVLREWRVVMVRGSLKQKERMAKEMVAPLWRTMKACWKSEDVAIG